MLEEDGSYSPSKLALKLGTVKKTDYDHSTYQKYRGRQSKVLVVCTEQKDMRMRNGKRFSTGNHPVEALVPMLHLREAGFEFEIVTATGQAAAFEMWAFPNEDAAVKGIFESYKPQFEQPGCLEDVAERLADARPMATLMQRSLFPVDMVPCSAYQKIRIWVSCWLGPMSSKSSSLRCVTGRVHS